jgi:hypothetical protein
VPMMKGLLCSKQATHSDFMSKAESRAGRETSIEFFDGMFRTLFFLTEISDRQHGQQGLLFDRFG